MRPPTRTRRRAGFALITSCFLAIGTLLFLGMAIDLGRIFVVKRELQAFCDEAATAAAFQLDGTANGITLAASAAATGPPGAPNRWDFGARTVTGVVSTFAQTPTGPFVASPAAAPGYRFVRVEATVAVPGYFSRILPGNRSTNPVSAHAISGQFLRNSLGNGMEPFSPDAHDPADPDFGFERGVQYTLKWAPNGSRDKPGGSCAGDVGFDPGGSSDRGYLNIGQGSGDAALRSVIVNNDYMLPNPLVVGGPLPMMVPGEKNTNGALLARLSQDTDITSPTYSTYHGNGRRILICVVNDHAPENPRVAGFGAFLLPPTPCGPKNTDPCCAEYIGPAVFGGTRRGGSTTGGLYAIQLY
jgi:Flp pilus assembly protein TadG